MGRILVDEHELESIRYGRSVGYGKEGTCYFLEEDNVIAKVYRILNKSRKIYFDTLSSPSISFPIDILMDQKAEVIVGYTMPFMNGKKIIDGFPNLRLTELKQAYLAIRKVISDYKDICMYDVCLENIFFDQDKKQFSLLDTSRWYPQFDSLNENLEQLNRCLLYALCQGNFSWLNEYLTKSPALFSLYRLYKQGESVPFLEFLDALVLELDIKFGVKAKTIDDLIPKMYKK